MKSRIKIIVLILFMSLVSGCSPLNSYQAGIYDDDAQIARQGDSYTFGNRLGSIKETGLHLEFGGFYGKQTVKEFQIETQRVIKLKITIKLAGGKFKVVLIDADNDVSILAEGEIDGSYDVPVTQGRNAIVIVGKNASGEVSMLFGE